MPAGPRVVKKLDLSLTRPERSRRITDHLSLALLAPKAPGQILILALAFLTIILILSAYLFGKIANYVRFGKVNTDTQQATFLAEAGIDYATYQINIGNTSYGGPPSCASPITLGTGQIEICVTGSATEKTITSTAYIPTKTAPKKIKRAISANISQSVALEVPFSHAAVSLVEDITLVGTARVDSGTIYSNRDIIDPAGFPCSSFVSGNAYYFRNFTPPLGLCPTVGPPGDPIDVNSSYDPTGPTPSVWKTLAQGGNVSGEPRTCTDETSGGSCNTSGQVTTCDPTCLISGTWGPHLFNGNVSCVYLPNGPHTTANITVFGTLYITGWFHFNCAGQITLHSSFTGFNSTVVIAEQAIWLTSIHSLPVQKYILFYSLQASDAAIEVKDRGIQAALWTPNGRTKIIDAGVGNISGCILGKSVRLESGSNLSYYSGCPDLDFGATALQLLSWQIKKGSYQLK